FFAVRCKLLASGCFVRFCPFVSLRRSSITQSSNTSTAFHNLARLPVAVGFGQPCCCLRHKSPLCVRFGLSQFLYPSTGSGQDKNLCQPTLHRAVNRLTAFFCTPLAPLAGSARSCLGFPNRQAQPFSSRLFFLF